MDTEPLSFSTLYKLIASTNEYSSLIENGKCRICNCIEPEVTFKKEAHLISRFLGSDLLIQDECDDCNALFSKWENDLAIFLRPFLAIHGVGPTKSKIPIFQSRSKNRDQQTRSTFDFKSGKREFNTNRRDDFIINDKDHKAQLIFRKPPYTPLNIYKILLKLAIELFPPDLLVQNRFMSDSLLNKAGSYTCTSMFRIMNPKKMYGHPQAFLFKANSIVVSDKLFPRYILIFAVTNLFFQIILPFDAEFMDCADQGLKIDIPCFSDSESHSTIHQYDLSISTTVLEDEVINLSFGNHGVSITV